MSEQQSKEWNRIVCDSAEEVLGTMFFCSVVGESKVGESKVGESNPNPCSDAISARVRFEGDPSGTLTIAISLDAARVITSNFLGTELNEPLPREVEQVTCELANIMCGNVLARNTSLKTFCLSPPEIVELTPPLSHSIAVTLEIEDGWFTTYLTFDGAVNGQ